MEGREVTEDLEQLASLTAWVEGVPFGDNETLVAPNDASLVPRVMVFDFVRVLRRDLSDVSADPAQRLQLHYLSVDLPARWERGDVTNVLDSLAKSIVGFWRRIGPQGCPNAVHEWPDIRCDEAPSCAGTCIPSKVTDGIRDIPICICRW